MRSMWRRGDTGLLGEGRGRVFELVPPVILPEDVHDVHTLDLNTCV